MSVWCDQRTSCQGLRVCNQFRLWKKLLGPKQRAIRVVCVRMGVVEVISRPAQGRTESLAQRDRRFRYAHAQRTVHSKMVSCNFSATGVAEKVITVTGIGRVP